LIANTAPREPKTKELDGEDVVSGFLYDRLQKELISLRNACQAKDDGLKDKEEENKVTFCRVRFHVFSRLCEEQLLYWAKMVLSVTPEEDRGTEQSNRSGRKKGKERNVSWAEANTITRQRRQETMG